MDEMVIAPEPYTEFTPQQTKTGNQRLLKLAKLLESVPRSKFDYTQWGLQWDGRKNSCGTKGCALGWACTVPSFRKLGLKMTNGEWGPRPVSPSGEESYAACAIFNIDTEQSYDLFLPLEGEYKATPKQVAKKIRNFVAGRIAKNPLPGKAK